MSSYYQQSPYSSNAPSNAAQNLQFYPSSYSSTSHQPPPVSGHTTPFQAGYVQSSSAPGFGGAPAFGGAGGFGGAGVSGRMGEQGGLRTGWLAAFGTEGYEGEPPLLEELGVNFGHIKMKTLTVLNPMARVDQHIMDDSDLAGPILFFLLFGFFLLFVCVPPLILVLGSYLLIPLLTAPLQSGKVHFGYIYGLALLGSTSLHVILSLMSPPLDPSMNAASHPHHQESGHHRLGSAHFSSTLTLSRSASVLGYCLLPLVLTSLIGIVAPMDTLFGYILTSAAIVWCTTSSSAMFCAVGRMSGMRGLVAYPLALFYVGFGIMGIFSSRGSGTLASATKQGVAP